MKKPDQESIEELELDDLLEVQDLNRERALRSRPVFDEFDAEAPLTGPNVTWRDGQIVPLARPVPFEPPAEPRPARRWPHSALVALQRWLRLTVVVLQRRIHKLEEALLWVLRRRRRIRARMRLLTPKP